ncbi:hypothetical protein HanIR_Chr04g0168801 [Helianthus annuus]|nr:hypothetical protein HanIR_Chr04g0168801 [Helianthus annuus]
MFKKKITSKQSSSTSRCSSFPHWPLTYLPSPSLLARKKIRSCFYSIFNVVTIQKHIDVTRKTHTYI